MLRRYWHARVSAMRLRLAIYRIKLSGIFGLPRFEGARLTWKRLLNCCLMRLEHNGLRTRLRSYPFRMIVEATNICNLRCPACYTGQGEAGRRRTHMSLELYRQLLAEMGDYLLEITFCNWGEPLLGRNIFTMVREASDRGIGTQISTNFSIPFDAADAEALVATRLSVLGVSLDGATQATFEKYRVGGDLETVLRNCRLVNDAKRRLGSSVPRMVWSYHVFPHNTHEVEQAAEMARDLGMDFGSTKGWLVGPDWDPTGRWEVFGGVYPFPCAYLWTTAVVNNDGGVSPCCGTFYREDDVGVLSAGGSAPGAARFRDVWNGERLREARALFRSRTGSEETRKRVCFDCPTTVAWERWQQHLAAGGDPRRFDLGYGSNDAFNYFWNRRPARADTAGARGLRRLRQ